MDLETIYSRLSSSPLSREAEYIELRFEDVVSENLVYVNGRVISIGSSRYRGIAIRVGVDGALGFSSTDIIEIGNLTATFEEAVKMAKNIRSKVVISDEDVVEGRYAVPNIKVHPRDVDWNEKLDFVKYLYDSARDVSIAIRNREFCPSDSEVKSITVRYASVYGDIRIMTSEGRDVRFEPLVIGAYVQAVANRDGKLGDGLEVIGGSIGYDDMVKKFEDARYNATWKAVEKTVASPPPAGYLPVIISHSVAGLFAHESFGHMSEGDFIVSKSSTLHDKFGEKIASEIVSIIDEGTPEYGSPIYLPIDDEGVEARRVYLVKDGVDNGFIHNRISAGEMGVRSTGNGRAEDYRHSTLVRMRNTFFGPGDWSEDEMIRESKEGIFVDDDRGGQAELDGTFTFSAARGYVIENGEKARPVRDIILTGNILEMLRYIEAAGKEVKIYAAPFGACGKGFQSVFVGLGGPILKVSKMQVGGKVEG